MCDGFKICCEVVENGVFCLILFDIVEVILWVFEMISFYIILMKKVCLIKEVIIVWLNMKWCKLLVSDC